MCLVALLAPFPSELVTMSDRNVGYEPSAEELGIGDTSDSQTDATAAAIDKQLEAGIELVRRLCTLPKVNTGLP